jgi:SGNH domain (fused to AT3 domains)
MSSHWTIDAIGPRKAFVVFALPEQKIDVPRTAALNVYLGRKEAVDLNRVEFDKRQKDTREALLGLADRLHFELLDASSLLCTASVCRATKDGFSLYSDDNHLNRRGAKQIESLFNYVFEPR